MSINCGLRDRIVRLQRNAIGQGRRAASRVAPEVDANLQVAIIAGA
jgi:hypothetical protein